MIKRSGIRRLSRARSNTGSAGMVFGCVWIGDPRIPRGRLDTFDFEQEFATADVAGEK